MKEKAPRMLQVHPLPSASAGHFPGDLTALFLTHVSRPGGPALFTAWPFTPFLPRTRHFLLTHSSHREGMS